jgi:hypothetical protein
VAILNNYQYSDYYSTMKFLYSILLLLTVITFASELVTQEKCQCPQVKCSANDAMVSTPILMGQAMCSQRLISLLQALCKCINSREDTCADECDDYEPQYVVCLNTIPLMWSISKHAKGMPNAGSNTSRRLPTDPQAKSMLMSPDKLPARPWIVRLHQQRGQTLP